MASRGHFCIHVSLPLLHSCFPNSAAELVFLPVPTAEKTLKLTSPPINLSCPVLPHLCEVRCLCFMALWRILSLSTFPYKSAPLQPPKKQRKLAVVGSLNQTLILICSLPPFLPSQFLSPFTIRSDGFISEGLANLSVFLGPCMSCPSTVR